MVKKVLVGSTPLSAAMAEAQRCGYEVSVLDKVAKVRPRSRNRENRKSYSGVSSASDSGPAPKRMVEQAVDEILHMKMLESIVDAAAPSTMVLASRDAAEAEYSAGFLKMVERALQKGWKLELVSFSRNIGFGYRDRDFVRKWKGRFTIITLDGYAELLLDL